MAQEKNNMDLLGQEQRFQQISSFDELVSDIFEDQVNFSTERYEEECLITLHRGQIFKELIEKFSDIDIKHSNIINVEMYETNGSKESALDSGGVFRDALSEFWNSFYDVCTNGTKVKVPAIREDFNATKWISVAKILFVGWKQVQYFPIKIAAVFMENCIFDKTISNLSETFLSFISESEKDIIKSALENFEETDCEELLDVLNNFECKRVPNPDTISSIIFDISHKEIIQKPKFIIDCWLHILANIIDLHSLQTIYKNCEPKSKNILSILVIPNNLGQEENKIIGFLKKYIRESEKVMLEKFLRFCTGADLITDLKITVEFKDNVGFQRTPVAHTCSGVLELDKSYENYPDFRSEFNSVLVSNYWIMDFA